MSKILQNVIVVWLFAAAIPPAGFCQKGHTLTVKVLDAKSSRAIKHMRLWLAWTNGPELPSVQTNDAGIAVFHLPDPLPDGHPWIWSWFIDMRVTPVDSIDRVFDHGIAGENSNGTVKFPGNPNPGELVIYARRVKVFQRMYKFWY